MAEVHIIGQIKEAKDFPTQGLYCKYYFQSGNNWRVISGKREGQTHVVSSSLTSDCSWSYPIDIHFATVGIQGWPKIYVQVYHLDWVGRSHLYGYGFVTTPTIPGTHILDCYTWRPSGSLRERFVQYFLGGGPQLKNPDLIFSQNDRYKLQTEAMGVISFEVTVILRNFTNYGVEYNLQTIVAVDNEISTTPTYSTTGTDLCKSDNCTFIATTEDLSLINTSDISNITNLTNLTLSNTTEFYNISANVTIQRSSIDSEEDQIMDFCTCDLQANICDINCCCDVDCNKRMKEVFKHCDDIVDRHYDTRYCNYFAYIYMNKTPSLWHINQNSLFCVIGSNKPKSFIVTKPLFSTPDIQNLELLKQQTWKKYDLSRKSGPSFRRFIFGDDIWIIKQTSLMKFRIPSSFITLNCNLKTEIKYLQNTKSSCIRNDDSSMEEYYKDIKIIMVPQKFNASLYFQHLENCPKNVCIEIEPNVCNFDFTYCEKIQDNTIIQLENKAHLNQFRKVWYKLYHNSTDGIVKADVFFALENVTTNTTQFEQDFEVSFLWHNVSIFNYSCLRSGNPGYLYGKPILLGDLITNKDNNSSPTIRIIRNSSEAVDNFLILPRSDQGFCILNNKFHEIINFGYNIRLTCKMQIILENRQNQSAADICREIQLYVFKYWSLPVNATYKKAISMWGNGNITNIETWKAISYNKEPDEVIASVNGTWEDPQNKTLHCSNFTSDLSIHILHYRLDYDSLKNQEKILNVAYNFSKPRNVIFDDLIKANQLNPEINSVMGVMFYDVTGNKQKKYVEPPSLRFRLPYDFFYPFVKVGANQAATISVFNCLFITHLFLILMYSFTSIF